MLSLKKVLKISSLLLIVALFSLFALYLSLRDELPDVNSLKNVQWQTPMKIFSQNGLLISQFGEKKRAPLDFDEIPQLLIDALLATEDNRFYLHFGVDPIGMSRAVLGQLMGENKGGASTITMQVARNFFLTREQTAIRKIREIFLSFHIESLLTKNEILALYINKIPLGHRSFGFAAAAQVYYGKNINELTLAQIAVLAGLPKAQSTYNPISSPKRAKFRRSVVLKRMLVSGYISEQDYQTANNAPITGKRHGAEIELNAPYIAEMAHQKMLSLYSKEQAYTGGYRVFTTITKKLQNSAKQAVINNLFRYDQRHGYRGALLSLRPDLQKETVTSNESANESMLTNDTQNQTLVELSSEEISLALSQVNYYQPLVPAVVVAVNEKSVEIILQNEVTATIAWSGLAWARAYINDHKQDTPPKLASDILSYGDVILVKEASPSEYHLSQMPQASAAMVSLSPDSGAIKAVVGGFNFKQSQFNRVTQAKRQVGSNIKPFIYSAALEHNYTLASLVNDAPINQWDKSSGIVWRPKNSPEVYVGPLRVRLALAQSKNVIAVRLLKSIGVDAAINHLSSFGFSPDDLPANESLALGSASLTPLEVATGFATFANGGFLIEPYLIDRIENFEGDIIYQANPVQACEQCLATIDAAKETENLNQDVTENSSTIIETISAPRVISEQNAFLITEAMTSAIWDSGGNWKNGTGWNGTGWRARALKRRDIAGKTGTTNEAKDAWFSGFSRRLVTTSWIGFDDHSRNLGQSAYNNNLGRNQIIGKEFGAKSAQPAWIDYMKTALADLPVEPFEPPAEIVSVRIDKVTGKLSNKTNKTSMFEYFQLGTAPTEYIRQDNSGDILDGGELEKEAQELF
ncbi:MAG: penicillin-binding protein 1A [Colwellia sp.]